MPKYLPVQLDAANHDIKAVYDKMEQDIGFVPNFIKTLAHSGNFLEAVGKAISDSKNLQGPEVQIHDHLLHRPGQENGVDRRTDRSHG
jgi:hypothetical protein